MFLFLCSALASQHPTDILPTAAFDLSGIQIIVGGDVVGEIAGSLNNTGTLHPVVFRDDGQQVDATSGDNIWSAHVAVTEIQHDSMLQLTVNGTTVWSGTVFGEQNCQQTIVKMILSDTDPVVKIVPCTQNATSQQQTTSSSSPGRVTAFYNTDTFVQTVSGLIFLGVGVLLGLQIRRRRSLPIQYLTQATPPRIRGIVPGAKQCWTVSDEVHQDVLLELMRSLSSIGPVFLITTTERRRILQQTTDCHSVFINQLDIPTMSDLLTSVDELGSYSPPVVLVSSLKALPDPGKQQNHQDVLLDFLHQLPGAVTCVVLTSETTLPNISLQVQAVTDIFATVESQKTQ